MIKGQKRYLSAVSYTLSMYIMINKLSARGVVNVQSTEILHCSIAQFIKLKIHIFYFRMLYFMDILFHCACYLLHEYKHIIWALDLSGIQQV